MKRRRHGQLEKLKIEEIAYIAGLLDGEGCISINKGRDQSGAKYRLVVCCANTDRAVLEFLYRMLGGRIYVISKSKWSRRTCWMWTTSSQQAGEILHILLPYLRIKKRQAKLAIKFCKRMVCKAGRGVRLSEKELAARKKIKKEISALNAGKKLT